MKSHLRIRNGFTITELLIAIIIGFILVTILMGSVGGCGTYSHGSRVGQVTKLSKKGAVFQTWEGELAMAGTINGQGFSGVGNVWQFSIPDDRKDLVEAIQAAMDKAAVVRISYEQTKVVHFTTGETRYRVTEVKVISPAETK